MDMRDIQIKGTMQWHAQEYDIFLFIYLFTFLEKFFFDFTHRFSKLGEINIQ